MAISSVRLHSPEGKDTSEPNRGNRLSGALEHSNENRARERSGLGARDTIFDLRRNHAQRSSVVEEKSAKSANRAVG
jgi:hypothetical protein